LVSLNRHLSGKALFDREVAVLGIIVAKITPGETGGTSD
jgi:hypothetical protein